MKSEIFNFEMLMVTSGCSLCQKNLYLDIYLLCTHVYAILYFNFFIINSFMQSPLILLRTSSPVHTNFA